MAHRPYSVRLDADGALRLAKQGASLLLLDVPPSLSFGIDLQMFVTGPKFQGVKMLPPGPHFIYYSATSKDGLEASPITGFFLHGKLSEVFVRRWDPKEEKFVRLTDADEEQRYALGVKNFDFDGNLAPYDIHHFKHWQELSKYITASVIDRFQPIGSDISIMAEASLAEQYPQTSAERMLNEHLQRSKELLHANKLGEDMDVDTAGGEASTSGRCFYTRLPRLVKRSGAGPNDLTMLNMDKSGVLELALKDLYGGSEDMLLGELQFSYVAFLMGQSLVSFSQWKAIVTLLFSCQEAPLTARTRLFVKFLDVLYHQMRQALKSGDDSAQFMDDPTWFSSDNFFGLLCKEFLSTLKTSQPVDGELLFQAKRLKSLLENSLGWDLDSEISYTTMAENDEYAPVVVETEEEQN